MDYDGFHQMVLGANLLPIKKGSLEGIHDSRLRWHGMNTHAALSNIMSQNYKDKEEILESYLDQYKKEEELNRIPKSQAEFEKYFCSKLKTSEEKFKYILNIPISEVGNIFQKEVNSELLVQVLKVFREVISDRLGMEEEGEKGNRDKALFYFIGDFLNLVGKSEGFDF